MKERNKVLIINNSPEVVRTIVEMLKDNYRLNASTDGFQAIDLAAQWQPDLIILDTDMPEINGFDICKQLQIEPETKNIPIVFITSYLDVEEEIKCIESGGQDYFPKNISPALINAKINNLINIKTYRDLIEKLTENKRSYLDEYCNTFFYTSMSVSEFRAAKVGKWHIKRCIEYVKVLLKQMIGNLSYIELTTTNLPEAICAAVPYHDIGKTVLPDEILLKPDKLTAEEYELIKSHTQIGTDLVNSIASEIKDELYLNTILDTIKYHHERWDGTGYPQGLSGANIPLSARIMALADQYDTLVSRRVYKDPSFHFEAVQVITEESGRGFDPDIVYIFLQVQDEFLNIMKSYMDED